ncbi:multidrug Oligosaccharidyl-lipid polysaccharide flippase [Lentinula raphanica]|uniref:Multidrug Oligosaccharidyl-lipid polysaccharide flippase n=1 Tax=Lentinula raphanica TaxID=153919 RepID=A0AA38PCM1_9AGAR|nr:multidrug Oligosaccharidyl-lipid polysaccharide flippase [Lentinula raphanica]
MSTIETQHGAYLASEPISGEYAVESTPLLKPTSTSGYRRSHSQSRESEAQDPREELPTLPLLIDQFSILLKYSLPVFGTHLLEYALLITSVLAVGHLGKLELAACTLGSMTANVTSFSIVIGMGGALDTVLPGVWGAIDSRLFGLWCQRMAVLHLLLLVSMLCIWLNAEKVLVFLRQNKEVARLAGRYLAMLAFGLPAFSFNTIAKRYFQAQGLFSIPTKIGTIVAGTNVLLTGALGMSPYLHLGFDGAPLATFISYNLVALGSAFWGWRIEDYDNFCDNEMRPAWHPLSMRALHPTGLGTLLTLGLGGVGQTASEWWAWELVGLAASLLGPTALAAQSVLLVSCSTTYQVPFALGVATSVRIGQLLGLARPRLAKLAAHAALLLGLALSLVFSAIFWIWRKRWAYVFNDDEDVAEMVARILPLVALFQVFDGNAAITGGILRARGKQGTGALLNLRSVFSLIEVFGVIVEDPMYPSLPEATAGLRGLWIGLTVSLVYCAVIGTALCLATDWKHELDKVQARVQAEDRRNQQENGSLHLEDQETIVGSA